MKADYHCGHIRHPVVFLQLVATVRQCFIRCLCRALYHDADRWLLLSAGIRFVDKPSVEEQSVGGRFQYRERVFYAGNKVDGKRIFCQSADQVLV